eukprot:103181_1
MFGKDKYTEKMLLDPIECLATIGTLTKLDESSMQQILAMLMNLDILPGGIMRIVYGYIDEGIWLIPGHLDRIDVESIKGNGGMYEETRASRNPEAMFHDGVTSFWCVWGHGNDQEKYTIWNFNKIVRIHSIKIRAEEYSDYSHFAKQIHIYAGKDEKHEQYQSGIKIITQQRGGWQYFRIVEKADLKGKYWRVVMNELHGKTYGEIAQIDFKGFEMQ